MDAAEDAQWRYGVYKINDPASIVDADEDRSADSAMRVLIVSRIFNPEPSAASFRLGVLASTLADSGNQVDVLTVKPPKDLDERAHDSGHGFQIRRFPVLRDRAGYVRGYIPYMSFDIPLVFRVLFARRSDVIVVEPPPTSGAMVRLAAAVRTIPYVYYAADIWSDGATQTGAPTWMVRLVKKLELFAMRGATTVLSVSESLTTRLAVLGIKRNVLTVGNGADSRPFVIGNESAEHYQKVNPPEFVYAGTASEWHGATVFIEALPKVLATHPDAKLRFIGSGTEIDSIEKRAAELGVSHAVTFEPLLSPDELSTVLRGATAALASIRQGPGNEFTFPTKLYASMLCGVPSIFAGVGPATEFLQTKVGSRPLGMVSNLDAEQVASNMLQILEIDEDVEWPSQVAAWALNNVSLENVAKLIQAELARIVQGSGATEYTEQSWTDAQPGSIRQ